MKCPKCGKPMSEMPTFPGYWKCPDYSIALNDRPPYRYKCEGSHLTDEGARSLNEEIVRLQSKRN